MTAPIADPHNIRVATTGRMYLATSSAAKFPITLLDEFTAWGPDWTKLGEFDTDAIEYGFSDDIEELRSWQNGVVRIIVKGRELTLKANALESSRQVVEAFHGGSFGPWKPEGTTVPGVSALTIGTTTARPVYKIGFEWFDGDPAARHTWRLQLETVQVSQVESPKFNGENAVKWGMTLKALGKGGVLAQWITNDPAVVGS
ncbi:hypothetical protein Lfu02_54940 [Longispora fulva]|uniref:Phage tail protein n=1 Tax=Longispora fulva TaxID=619741 RepID=A0A8J7KK15_9ACTN|nr:hypothetical protein [Longispora fulva]MBG6137524.1 hypothetical protein [Longispora fulva]GIG61122.1 hypothetical protein Lfu02_54940 [Longispora fulva]